ncbi:hypothetical protein [Parachitinimonas caeni]|uniref:Outer membrane protein beta-barrel domain-containing protein n=1 Tax=Parachitinimonas caeni TaxID=3031301 RepID=A0ABT7DTT6_9NEIS|nr:hypothetical protein [Parachitinimonas caeni]MDK2122498.1 hypothetical protein [Parachitinimonas caeni]
MSKQIIQGAIATALGLFMASPTLAAEAHNPRNVRFVMQTGLTYGGDQLAEAQYTNGGSTETRAGSLVQLGAGVVYQPTSMPLALQLTMNYHIDNSVASNGDMSFKRIPIEATLFYTGVEKWRFGLGARYVRSPSFSLDYRGTVDIDYEDTVGLLLEAGYKVSDNWWLSGRFVSEKFKPKMYKRDGREQRVQDAKEIDGTHGGLFVTGAF